MSVSEETIEWQFSAAPSVVVGFVGVDGHLQLINALKAGPERLTEVDRKMTAALLRHAANTWEEA